MEEAEPMTTFPTRHHRCQRRAIGILQLFLLQDIEGTSKRLSDWVRDYFLFRLPRAPRTARQEEYRIGISNTTSLFRKLPL